MPQGIGLVFLVAMILWLVSAQDPAHNLRTTGKEERPGCHMVAYLNLDDSYPKPITYMCVSAEDYAAAQVGYRYVGPRP